MKSVRVVTLMVYMLALAACSGGDKKLELGGSCSLNSDCADGLLCKFGACHKACVKSVDCATGERCVQVDGVAVCQTIKEAACGINFTCSAPLMCRQADNSCRNKCTTVDDCLGGQVCSGTFCVENKENTPSLDGGAGADGPTADAATTGADAPVVVPDVPLAPVDGSPIDAPAGDAPVAAKDAAATPVDTTKSDTTPSTVCTPACTVGQECVSGTCQPCGRSAGQPCCAGVCNANLTCDPAMNQCACGGQDQACCEGKTCNTELKCLNGACTCGEFGYACCAGNTCNNGGLCAGVRCGCLKSCDSGFYLKTDGTFGGKMSLKNQDGSPCNQALSVAADQNTRDTAACIVRSDGTVWCQGSNARGLLGGGNASMTSSNSLVQVLTGVAGTPLVGIAKVALSYDHACALANDGGVWCWGAGDYYQLGNGLYLGSAFAVPVLDSPGGARLADASDISLGYSATCALKKDGTVWCWGNQSNGQLGNGVTTGSGGMPTPTKVAQLPGTVSSLSASSNSRTTCVIDAAKSVWCWGANAGPDGGSSGSSPSPVRLVLAKNGAAVTNVVQVDAGKQMLRRSDGSILQWSSTSTSPVAENGTAVSGALWLGAGCWIGADGSLRGITNPTCP